MTLAAEELLSLASDKADNSLLRVNSLCVKLPSDTGGVDAVNGVSFVLDSGKTLGILGESGSGKSITLKAMMGLLPKKSEVKGQVILNNFNISQASDKELRSIRGPEVAMIFQEPMSAFDPVFTVGDQIVESIVKHEKCGKEAAWRRIKELFELVQIPSPERRMKNYPHELSGGMRQRAMIALALACRPKLLLADEPTTALDVTVQIQILRLLKSIQEEMGMGLIFVTHDIGVATEVSDDLAIMYAGRFVEYGPLQKVLDIHAHPYTEGLLNSTVHGGMRGKKLHVIPGSPPDLHALPKGCPFSPRCNAAESQCLMSPPENRIISKGHSVRCIKQNFS